MGDIKYNHIAIEGIIGAGKSTLTNLLAQKLDARTTYEEFDDNPFLPLFYKEPERYALQLELSFLAARFHQLTKAANQSDLFQPIRVSDYWFDKCLVFAQNNLTEVEFQLYRNLFDIIHPRLSKPDLIVYLYLTVDDALKRIEQRGRSYEQDIQPDYLSHLHDGYWRHLKSQSNQKIIVLNAMEFDFLNHENDVDFLSNLLKQNFENGITRISK